MEQSIAKAKALSSPIRVKILQLLKKRPHTLSEVGRELRISKTNAKVHLAKLLSVGLVEEVPRSKWKYYSVKKDLLENDALIFSIPLISLFLALVSLYSAFQNTVPVISQDNEYSVLFSFTSTGWIFLGAGLLFGTIFAASLLWIVLKRVS